MAPACEMRSLLTAIRRQSRLVGTSGSGVVRGSEEALRLVWVLSVLHPYTRECLALEVDMSFARRRVTQMPERLIAGSGSGRPDRLRCYGPELTNRRFLAWCVGRKVQLAHIEPGRPMQNGQMENFQSKVRNKCLNVVP